MKRNRIIDHAQVLVAVLVVLGMMVGLAVAVAYGIYWVVDAVMG